MDKAPSMFPIPAVDDDDPDLGAATEVIADDLQPWTIRVLNGKCSSCIFRPNNLMHLQRGRVRSMVAEATRRETVIPCHSFRVGDGPASLTMKKKYN